MFISKKMEDENLDSVQILRHCRVWSTVQQIKISSNLIILVWNLLIWYFSSSNWYIPMTICNTASKVENFHRGTLSLTSTVIGFLVLSTHGGTFTSLESLFLCFLLDWQIVGEVAPDKLSEGCIVRYDVITQDSQTTSCLFLTFGLVNLMISFLLKSWFKCSHRTFGTPSTKIIWIFYLLSTKHIL